MKGPVAFLFLGETLLIPHLYPIVEALSEIAPDVAIDLWVGTSVHENLLTRWTADLNNPRLRIRRAPGFRTVADDGAGRNPPLPAKLPMLARLAPYLWRVPVVVSAEQTSLWLPRVLPIRARFVNTFHGAGSMTNRDDPRRRAAWRTLVASKRERDALAENGVAAERIAVTGYVKAAFRQRTHTQLPFADRRPVVLYAPHWQRHRSSWWAWGRQAVEQLAAQDRYNVIIAPHQRLAEKAPELRDLLKTAGALPHVHTDLDGFAMVDGSYTAAADIYLGDTSSQVIEFLMQPRPCMFLDPRGTTWQSDPSYAMWACGEVVTTPDRIIPALIEAPVRHATFRAAQTAFATSSLGDTSGAAAGRAAAEIVAALRG
ncbi:CDP-glycerol glycerophosphotransferase family protein [Sphingomonas sp. SUN019]|uniref:CDP-glycerol glycerophosphotransferase family protein n=1 Tax=Sphingomonas sp. SUN019 TaxID=2937788 RepID=UPI002164352F|nr:CDP-glycerol glycerophosphotransferase family protein [Sphingomonas sp. SUN019]UVO50481.1 CDP-glycerol glycerophosphotransferase family protein [Sphingomonas sp. SUN019]